MFMDSKTVKFCRFQHAPEKQSTGSFDNSDEKWNAWSFSTMTEEEATQLQAETKQLRKKNQMVWSSTSTAQTAQVEELQAENALLRQQLKEALVFICDVQLRAPASTSVPNDASAAASLAASISVPSLAASRQKQSNMEQVIQDNDFLQGKLQEMKGHMVLFMDVIDHLKNQLSAERQRCADAEELRAAAEEQRWAQKELFQKIFTQIKHDMAKCNRQQASMFMNDKRNTFGSSAAIAEQHFCLFNQQKPPASELFAEEKFKDETAKHSMQTSSRFLLAEDSLRSAALSCNGTPITTSPSTPD